MQMQRGYKILIVSGILFVASLSIFLIWGITFSGSFITNNQGISTNQITLPPLQSYNTSVYIDSTERLLTLTIDSINNDQLKLREIMIGPDGEIISNSTFQKTYFSTIKPNKTGEYKMTVENLANSDSSSSSGGSSSNASLYILFGILPFLTDNGELDLNSFAGLIIGIILFLAGIISLAIGIVFFIKDRNKLNYRGYIPR
jgi:hypothetical protein